MCALLSQCQLAFLSFSRDSLEMTAVDFTIEELGEPGYKSGFITSFILYYYGLLPPLCYFGSTRSPVSPFYFLLTFYGWSL
jgi:hypothetical protein